MFLKEHLAAGRTAIGAGIYSYSIELLEYAAGGMDWIWWEAQHSHPNWETTVCAVRAAYAMRIPVLIRSWTDDGSTIERLLDTGAEGIIVPMVNTPEQAERIVSRCYYPPVGIRSFGATRIESVSTDIAEWNKRIMTVMMIETPQGVENAEAIANVHGVDALLIGATDLALRLGRYVDSKRAHAEVREHVEHVADVCRKAGKAAAVIATSPQALSERISDGYRLICAGMDVDHAKDSFAAMRDTLGKVTSEIQRPRDSGKQEEL